MEKDKRKLTTVGFRLSIDKNFSVACSPRATGVSVLSDLRITTKKLLQVCLLFFLKMLIFSDQGTTFRTTMLFFKAIEATFLSELFQLISAKRSTLKYWELSWIFQLHFKLLLNCNNETIFSWFQLFSASFQQKMRLFS